MGKSLGDVIVTADRLPPENTYVLARYAGGNWHDAHDDAGCGWKVVKLLAGYGNDLGNNQRPYEWKEFGPGRWFGQQFDLWCHLPRCGRIRPEPQPGEAS